MKLGYVLLYVDDVARAMDFYEKAFGLTKGFFVEQQYGEMVSGETKLGFVHHAVAGSHGFSYRRILKSDEAPGCEIGFVTEDVFDAFHRALRAGAVGVSEPVTKPWGQIVSYVRDLNGFLVEICSEIPG